MTSASVLVAVTPPSAGTKIVRDDDSIQAPSLRTNSPIRPQRMSRGGDAVPTANKAKINQKQTRYNLRENYEEPLSGREDWWRSTIKETPGPGTYEVDDFITLYNKNPIGQTYRFKSDGRRKDPNPHGKGSTLLPGAYNRKDFIEELDALPLTYNFKSTGRRGRDLLNHGLKDKDVDVSPVKYPIEKYLSITAEKQSSKHSVFKSQIHRFPTIYFVPKEGPPPGAYEPKLLTRSKVISSSFTSKTPRFRASHTKVPGPGTYEKTFQMPMSNTIARMGRQHGLFFSSAFET